MDQGQWDTGYWVHQCDKCEARELNVVEIEMASAIIIADVRMEFQTNKTPEGRAAHGNAPDPVCSAERDLATRDQTGRGYNKG